MNENKEELKNIDVQEFEILPGSVIRIKDGKEFVEMKINNNIRVRATKTTVITGELQ